MISNIQKVYYMPLNKKTYKSHKGFTLAEILLVIVILGIVAAITIPSIIRDITDIQYKTVWKSTYSAISQAVRRSAMEHGGTIDSLCHNTDCFRNTIIPYLNIVKACNQTATIGTGNCFSLAIIGEDQGSAAILSNGVGLFFAANSSDCSGSFSPNIPKDYCGWMAVDTNGFKPPNEVGKDIFRLWVGKRGIYPFGIDGDTFINNPAGNSAKYLYQ